MNEFFNMTVANIVIYINNAGMHAIDLSTKFLIKKLQNNQLIGLASGPF